MYDNDHASTSRDDPPAHSLDDAAAAEKKIADVIEAAVDTPGSIEEEQLLEAAELLEVEYPES